MSSEDMRHQGHYERLEIEPIILMAKDLSPEEFRGYLKGNIIKYILRLKDGYKQQDYEKALVYTGWLVEFNTTGKLELKKDVQKDG